MLPGIINKPISGRNKDRMKSIRQPHDPGQRPWPDNITGLTSHPGIFDTAIGGGDACNAAIHARTPAGLTGEALFTALALERLRRAADPVRPVFDATNQTDGGVSMEIPPLFVADTAGAIAAARQGRCAFDPPAMAGRPAPDLTPERTGGVAGLDVAALPAPAEQPRAAP